MTTVTTTPRDWKRLAEAIRDARKARGWRQEDLAEAAGTGYSTVQRAESSDGYKTMPLTIDKIERALGWAPGSARTVLEGGTPTLVTDSAIPGPAAETPAAGSGDAAGFVARLPARIQHELADGELVDTDVIELKRKGMRLIVFATRDPEQAPEDRAEKAEDIREWTRVQRRLRGLASDGDSLDK
ncbi:helix-turn-helix transcriptional regulator [Streptomyces sp. NPDC052107]|uniref:helix-turn-helix domain-containing protein n=1 Tax=Streptomyces sp. NPDC052107 TaxID=3155632 RepID=UPI003436B2B3